MTRYLLWRTLQSVLALYLMVTAVFFFIQIVMPGDYASQFIMTGEARDALREQLGLNVPVWQQYVDFLTRLAQFNLGTSFRGTPVSALIEGALPNTALVFLTGLTVAFLIGQHLGRVTAWRGSGPITEATTVTTIAFYAFFPPALGYIMNELARALGITPQYLGVFQTEYVQAFGAPPLAFYPRMLHTLLAALALTLLIAVVMRRLRKHLTPLWYLVILLSLWVGSWLVLGIFWPVLLALRVGFAIPLIAFTLLSMGEIMVITRTSMEETLTEQYIETARAKGLRPVVIRDKHAARNALLPVLSKLVTSLPYLLAGLVIIEQSVGWNGIGSLLFNAVAQQDLPVVMGVLVVIGVVVLACRFILELVYVALDPRMRRTT